MEWNKQQLRGWLTVVCGGILFYTILQNPGKVMLWLGRLMGVLSPFLLGGTIAFILSVPMRSIERRLFPNAQRVGRFRRPLALVLTLLAVSGVLALAFCVIGPGAADALRSVVGQLPGAIRRLEALLTQLEGLVPRLEPLLAAVDIDWTELTRKAGLLLQTQDDIASIAQAVGYESQSRFSSAFREQYGALPTEYRRRKGQICCPHDVEG